MLLDTKAILAFSLSAFSAALPAAFGQSNILSGEGTIVHADITHPNGNIYDQLLITGQSITVAADEGQIVRVSFIDPSNDIIQCEFSGSGTMRIDFDPNTFSEPAAPLFYNQPDVEYAKGLASITLDGTDELSSIGIYSIGTVTSSFAALFRDDVVYDGLADISLLTINGDAMGSIFAGNVRFSATSGYTGINAPGTKIHGRLVLQDIKAFEAALPVLRIANDSPLGLDNGSVLIAAGNLEADASSSVPFDIRPSTGKANLKLKSVEAIRTNGDAIDIKPISRKNTWETGGGYLYANDEKIISIGLATYPANPNQLSNYRFNPFQISESENGFYFDEQLNEWKYEEIQFQEGIEASITYAGDYSYELTKGGTGFNIVLDYDTQSVSLAGFTRTTTIVDQSDPPLPKSTVISFRSNGNYEYLVTLSDGTEQTQTGNFLESPLLPLRLPGLKSLPAQP